MKTLANCTPVEFLKQTNKIRHEVENLIVDTGIKDILKRQPVLTGKETREEKEEKIRKQNVENLNRILDVLMDANAEKTVEVLGLMCFMSHDEVLQTTMPVLFEPVLSMLNDVHVVDFFTSLLKLGLTITRG